MARRTSIPLRDNLTRIYRLQIQTTGKTNHIAAGREAGCTRQTAAEHYHKPWPGTSTTGPRPAIVTVLQGEAADAAAARAAAVRAEHAGAAAGANLAAPAPPAVAAPVTAATDHEADELRILSAARSAAEGLVCHSVGLLSAFSPLVRSARRRLELLAQDEELDVRATLTMHEQLGKSLHTAAVALEKLVSVQSTLSSRPTSTTAIRVERGAERLSDDEIRRRADMVAARLKAGGIDLEVGEEPGSDPVDIEATEPAALAAAAEGAPHSEQEAAA